jgi:hypothetical protein
LLKYGKLYFDACLAARGWREAAGAAIKPDRQDEKIGTDGFPHVSF